ncbi:MAG: hypothetical protein HY553_08660 [Elusimicrobia bacterium]|nr:hypothetical protein [Elusimicrobiota bacterium]
MTKGIAALALAGILASAGGPAYALAQPGGAPPVELQGKIKRLQDAMAKREQSGVPPIRIALTMSAFEPLIKEGKFAEAEAVVDRALQLAEKAGKDPFERKLQDVFEGVQKLERVARRMELVGMVMARVEGAVKAGDETAAEGTLDLALKLLRSDDPAKLAEAAPYLALQAKMKALQEKAQRVKSAGGDDKAFAEAGAKVQEALKAGRPEDGAATLEEILTEQAPAKP